MLENTFKNVQFTFQIGLHIDDIETLQYIKDNLKCGHISKSGNRENYFVNDINSLMLLYLCLQQIFLLTVQSFIILCYLKKQYYQQRINFIYQGKLDILKLKKEMQNMSGRWVPD